MIIKLSRQQIIDIIIGTAGIFICIFAIILNFKFEKFACICVLILSVYLLIWGRKSYLLSIMFAVIAYCNYSIAFSEYLHIIPNTLFTMYSGTAVAQQGIYILLLFMSLLIFFLGFCTRPMDCNLSSKDFRYEKDDGNIRMYLVLGIDLFLIAILIFAFQRPSQLGDRGTPSALYEYSILFFILGFYFGRQYRITKLATLFILFLFVLQNFIYGGRIAGLQMIIVAYLMIWQEKISLRKTIPYVIIGFFALNLIGALRGNILSGNYSISLLLKRLANEMFTLDTAYSAYHTSLTFVLTEQTTSFHERFTIFMGFIKSIFLGGYASVTSSVAHYTAQYFQHYYGGILPFFFKFYMGWGGIVLIAGYLVLLIGKVSKLRVKTSGILKCISVYIIATTFRWYLYSPIQLTRSILLLVIGYFFIICFSRFGSKNSVAKTVEN